MSYGFYRLGSHVAGKVLPSIGPVEGSAVILDPRPLPAETVILSPTDLGPPKMSPAAARQQGYTGNGCVSCGSARLKVSGHCEVCEDCGTTTGCS